MKGKRAIVKELLLQLEQYNYRFHLLYNGNTGRYDTPEEISAAIPLTDFDRVLIYNLKDGERDGSISLVYDVDRDEEVIADWSGDETFMLTMIQIEEVYGVED